MPQGSVRRAVRLSAAWIVALGCARAVCAAAPTPPVVPGYYQLKAGKADPAALGELLLGELNCTACHAPDKAAARIDQKGAPDLSRIGSRVTPQWLQAYLASPHALKPGTTMPDIFHASDDAAKKGAVDFLTHFLMSQGAPITPATEDGNSLAVDQGRVLFHSVGCVACHAPEKNPDTKIPSVPLGNLAMKTTVDELAAFLLDPLKARPAGRMPNLGLGREEAVAIATYLLRDQMNNPQGGEAVATRVHGIKFSYFEGDFPSCTLETLSKLKPVSEGKVPFFSINDIPKHRSNMFAVRFTGAIAIPKDGHYTFHLRSDDGSLLYLDNKAVIDNDGIHPPAEKSVSLDLKAGDHPITVTFLQGGGGWEFGATWEGPGIRRQVIPNSVLYSVAGRAMIPLETDKSFKVDADKAQMGEGMFQMMGCANCHALPKLKPGRPAKALAALALDADTGCLGEHVAKGLPQYDLSADQRQAIRAALGDGATLAKAREPKEQVTHALAAMNCFGCHNRDGVGGPAADRTDYFVMAAPFDMGDEGRLPPRLTNVGAKLLTSAIEQIVFEGKLHVRDAVLATRMPIFSRDKIGYLPEALAKTDAAGEDNASKFSELAAHDGRQLVGTKGLGCVNCHGVADVKSLGMPAPNLSTAHPRLRVAWFKQLLDNPAHVNPGTRMPAFWDKGDVTFKQIAGGTEAGQIDAVWAYLSLGTSMALPIGLQPTGGYELVPTEDPIVHRTFMADVGSRAVLVGYPEMVHIAFDANAVRLAKAWRGRFFDAKGQWDGRGGQSFPPLGTDVINMPAGPSFAVLAKADAPWPLVAGNTRNVGGHFKGYILDKQERPIFHYLLDAVQIEEQPVPVLKAEGPGLIRKFHLTSARPVEGLQFLAGAGAKIESPASGVYTIDGKLTVKLNPDAAKPTIRTIGSEQQLLLPVTFTNGAASFDVELSW